MPRERSDLGTSQEDAKGLRKEEKAGSSFNMATMCGKFLRIKTLPKQKVSVYFTVFYEIISLLKTEYCLSLGFVEGSMPEEFARIQLSCRKCKLSVYFILTYVTWV